MKSAFSQHEYSVTELSYALKRTLGDTFSSVRVRGEISSFKRHSSGHCYLRLKDNQTVLEAIIWKNVASCLGLKLEEGLEVVVTGRITTYPGRSSYQILIESMVVSGTGALLKLLEERRHHLADEGLFDIARKKKLPFLPQTIGIITSPTGAAIRDILHRLNDRFPCQVLLWPVTVQGESAAAQIVAAIVGFNKLLIVGSTLPKPDVLIITRGGGSLEDLWPFNEEEVVRAAAASTIPLISAIGHETDTTLIDFAADRRAPTPTAAAEMVVPVRLDLLSKVERYTSSLSTAIMRSLNEGRRQIEGLVRGLPDPRCLIEDHALRLDDRTERLFQSVQTLIERLQIKVAHCFSHLPNVREQIITRTYNCERIANNLHRTITVIIISRVNWLEQLIYSMRTIPLWYAIRRYHSRDISALAERLLRAVSWLMINQATSFGHITRLLESYSCKSVLRRGFALVWDSHGQVVDSTSCAVPAAIWIVALHDGTVPVRVDIGNGDDKNRNVLTVATITKRSSRKQNADTRQSSLF